jgi:beta-lactam-binding protein with PASTA domain
MSVPPGEWPADTTPLPPAPPAVPPEADPSNRIGLGMLLAIVLLAAAGAGLAAVLIARHHHHHNAASATTVIVTTTPTSLPTTTARAKKKLILPVPDLVGRQWNEASAGLRRAGFHVSFATVRSALPRGVVTAQDPKPGAKVAKGSDVRLNVSTGVGGPTSTTTRQATTPATTTAATTQAATTTSASTTSAATTTTAQTTTQAAQPTSAQVPSLSGDLQPALQQLDQAGFHASIAYVPGTQPLGTVIAQSPAGGATAKTGSQITVNVSSGPGGNPEETIPNVVGQRIPQALGALHSAGLRLVLLNMRVSDRAKAGVIVAQTPLPGKRAPKNAQVLVYLGAFQQ